jgi:hypothetical protein
MTRSISFLLAFAAIGLLPLAASARALTVDSGDESQLPRTVVTENQQPQGPFPPPPPRGEPRTISATVLAGPGWLALRDDLGRDGQQATGLAARLGVVVGPEWNLFVAVDHTRAERGHVTFSQTAATLGLQRFLFERLYLGGALGLAWVREHVQPDGLADGPGGTVSGHLGIEVFRSEHTALAAEVSFTLAQYQKEQWEMGGVRLGLLLF